MLLVKHLSLVQTNYVCWLSLLQMGFEKLGASISEASFDKITGAFNMMLQSFFSSFTGDALRLTALLKQLENKLQTLLMFLLRHSQRISMRLH